MSGVALALVLAAAGIHAGWNLLAKRLPGGAEAVWVFTAVATVLYLPLAAASVLAIGYRPHGVAWLFLIGTGVLQAVYFVTLRRGYASGDLSVVYPLARGTGPLVAVALATALLGESPSGRTVAGALVISVGALALATPARADRAARVGVAYGVATGVVIGGYTVWDGYAVGTLAIPPLLLAWAADAGRLAWLTPLAARRRSAARALWSTHRWALIAIGMLSTGSYALVLAAMAIAPVSSVAPAREVSIVLGTLLGTLLLGEPGGCRRVAAAAIITTGVLLVAAG